MRRVKAVLNVASILLFTALYPESTTVSRIEQTFAIHNLVKYWKDDDLLVVKPVRVRIKNFLRAFRVSTIKIDGISIVSIPFIQVPLLDFPSFISFFLLLGITLRKRSFTPEIALSHYDISHIIASRVSRARKIPHIAVVHNADLNRIARKGVTGTRVLRSILSANSIAFRSEQIQKKFNRIEGVTLGSKATAIIASGVEQGAIIPSASFFAKALVPCTRIVTVAALKKRKNIMNIIEALREIRDIPWHFTVIGDGEERKALETAVARHGLSDKVFFTGLLDHANVMSSLESSNIFILPSEGETFGLAYLEAMAKGCIVIALKGEGIDGVIESDINGFLCETPSPDEIARTLKKALFLNEDQRMKMLKSAYETVNEYTESYRSDIYRSVVQSTLDKGFSGQ